MNLRYFIAISLIILCALKASFCQSDGLYIDNCAFTLKGNILVDVDGELTVNANTLSQGIQSLDSGIISLSGNLTGMGTQSILQSPDFTHIDFDGKNAAQEISSASGLQEFHKISMNNAYGILLNNPISINDTLRFIQGDINLNNQTIDFTLRPIATTTRAFGDGKPVPFILNENENHRIVGNGVVRTNGRILPAALNNGPYNFANLGFAVDQPGMTDITIIRGEEAQLINNTRGISKYFDVTSANPDTNEADLKFHFLNTDLSTTDNEEFLNLYRHDLLSNGELDPNGTWIEMGKSAFDATKKIVSLDASPSLYNQRWTLHDCANPEISIDVSDRSVCAGEEITLTVDQLPNTTILWSTGESTPSINVTSESPDTLVISVKVSLPSGCFTDDTVKLYFSESPQIDFTFEKIESCLQRTLTLQPTVIGTDPMYTWSTGDTTNSLDYLVNTVGSKTISLTVAISDGCTAYEEIEIEGIPTPTVDLGVDTFYCNKSTDILDAGSGSNYSYSWSPGSETSQQIAISGLNTYSVTVTNDNTGCSASDTVAIGLSRLFVTRKVTNPTCSGNDGEISITIQRGTAPFSIHWGHTPDTSQILTGLSAGTYDVTVTDAVGCQKIFNGIKLTVPPPLDATYEIASDDCRTGEGKIVLHPKGGTPPYDFIWRKNDGTFLGNTKDIGDLFPGTYSIRITDNVNCTFKDTVIIQGPLVDVDYTVRKNNIHCDEELSYGSISIDNLQGGNPPYNFNWSTGASSSSITDLGEGLYSLTVRDVLGCLLIENSWEIAIAESLLLSDTHEDPSCVGNNDGSIQVQVENFTGDLIYRWNTGDTTSEITNLGPAIYNVTVTNSIGNCPTTKSISLFAPQQLSIRLDSVDISSCASADGAIYITPSGSGGYTYDWSHNGPDSIDTDPQDITNLALGTYQITLTDANSCALTSSFTLGSPNPLELSITSEVIGCGQHARANLIANAHGGIGQLTYLWSTGDATSFLSDQVSGNYSVTVTDESGCIRVEQAIVEVTEALEIIPQIETDRCAGDSTKIKFDISGGRSPYTLSFSHNYENIEQLSYAPAGTYRAVVVDAMGCSEEVSFELTEPDRIDVVATVEHATSETATDGSIIVSPISGVLPFEYAWATGQQTNELNNIGSGTYVLTVTDAQGCRLEQLFWHVKHQDELIVEVSTVSPTCNETSDGAIYLNVKNNALPIRYEWSTGDTTSFLENRPGGTYDVTVSNQQGLDTIFSVELESLVFQRRIETENATCQANEDGLIRVLFPAYIDNYRLTLDGMEYMLDSLHRSVAINDLAQGFYPYTITSSEGCLLQDSIRIASSPALDFNIEKQDAIIGTSPHGSAYVNIVSGTPDFDYQWSNDYTGQGITGLAPGTYQVSVSDGKGCQTEKQFVIEAYTQMTDSSIVFDNTCDKINEGQIEIRVQGGVPPYHYNWNTGDTTAILTDLSQGRYYATATDVVGQQIELEFLLLSYERPTKEAVVKPIQCANADNGEINILVTGNTAPYQIAWTDGSTEFDRQDLAANMYAYTVTDRFGCEIDGSVNLTNPDSLAVSTSITDATSSFTNDGEIVTIAQGGTAPYSYIWEDGTIDSVLRDLLPGPYTLNLIDMNGCHRRDTFLVKSNLGGVNDLAVLVDSADITCFGANDGQIQLTVQGGIPPYSFEWETGDTSSMRSNLAAGTYTVTISDEVDSSLTRSITLAQPQEIIIVVDSIMDDRCANSNGRIDISVTGGASPYTFKWNDGSENEDLLNLMAGTYNLTVTDNDDCVVERMFEVEASQLLASLDVIPISCFEAGDGSINVQLNNPVGNVTFEWNTGDDTQSILTEFPGDYDVIITDQSNCVLELSATVDEPDFLTSTIQTVNTPGCNANQQGEIKVLATGGTAPYTYQWSNGDESNVLSNIAAGEYNVTVTDINGCVTTASTNLVGSGAPIEARFYAASPVNSGDTVQFIDVTFPIPTTRKWYFGDPDGQTSTEEDPQFIYPFNGSEAESIYPVTLVVNNGACTDSLTKNIRIINTRAGSTGDGLDSRPIVTQVQEVSVFPNPNMGEFNLIFLLNKRDDAKVTFYNSIGKKVFERQYSNVYYVKEYFENLQLANDTYILEIVAGKDRHTEKFIIIQ